VKTLRYSLRTYRGCVCRNGLLRYLILMCKMQTLIRSCKMNSLICVNNHCLNAKPGWQCHVNTAVTNPKFCAAVEPLLLAFPISYMLESGVSHANAFLKQNNRLNSEDRDDSLLNTPILIKMLLLFLTGQLFSLMGSQTAMKSLPFSFCACINNNASCSLPFNCS